LTSLIKKNGNLGSGMIGYTVFKVRNKNVLFHISNDSLSFKRLTRDEKPTTDYKVIVCNIVG